MPLWERADVLNFVQWLFLLCFFIAVPPAVLYTAASTAEFLADPEQPVDLLQDFRRDLPFFLLSFYSGTAGGVIAYVYDRHQLRRKSDPVVTKTAKLLSSGLLGVAVFLLLRSAVLVKLFYPNVDLTGAAVVDLEYQPTLIAALVAGLAGPALVRRLQLAAK